MEEKIKIGVIGAGNMGKNHIRILSEERNFFELVSFYDCSAERALEVSKKMNIKAAETVDEVLDKVDAVVIAVPSSLHLDIGELALQSNLHALIEKPLAINYIDALTLCEAFKKAGRTLMVGHVERFNPTVVELQKLLTNEEIIAVEARRYSPFDGRITDASVISDLMIHDIDIICNALDTTNVRYVNADGRVVKSQMLDFAQAHIQFESGMIASIAASRITENKVRKIAVHTKESYIIADLLLRSLVVSKHTDVTINSSLDSSYRQESITQKILVPTIEPLRAELLAFRQSILSGQEPVTSGNAAARALSLAEVIQNKITQNNLSDLKLAREA